MSDGIVDATGESVSVDWGALAERSAGYIAWGWILSVLSFVELVGGGVVNALVALKNWIEALYAGALGIPTSSLDAAGDSAVAWVSTTGVLGLVLGVLISVAAIVLAFRGLAWVAATLRGGIA